LAEPKTAGNRHDATPPIAQHERLLTTEEERKNE
jgi:hypothetical protein